MYFHQGVVTVDQIIFGTEQKGIQEIVLHHLFKGQACTVTESLHQREVQLVSVLKEEHCAFAAFVSLEFLYEVELHPSGMCVRRAFPRSQQSRRRGIAVILLSRA